MFKFDDILNADEKVVWRGKPEKKAYVLPGFGFIPFALVFSLVFAIIIYGQNSSGTAWFLPVAIGLVIGLLIGLIPPLWLSTKFPSVEYMITNQRFLIKSGIAEEDVWFTKLDNIKETIVKIGIADRMVGTGKLYPITPDYPYAPKLRSYSRGGMYNLKKEYNIVEGKEEEVSQIELFRMSQFHPHFEGLKKPYDVQKIIKEAKSTKEQLS